MKKKIILYSVLGALALVILVFGVWYYTPKTFLNGVSADEIGSIEVFDGSTGKRFVIENADEIKTLVENLQENATKRGKMSVHYDGIGFSLKFLDTDGNLIDSFAVNSKETVRDDPFFYHTKSNGFCYDYLDQLEQKYATPSIASDWGVSFEVKNVTGSGLTLVCKQSQGYADGDLQTGSFYVVETLQNGTWKEVTRLPQENDVVWTSEAWMIPREHTVEWEVDWGWLYGNLPTGQYRIGKEIMNFRGTGDFDKAMAYAEFTVS